MDFEQHLREQLEGFTMPLEEDVWSAVSSRLAAKRRKVVFLRWGAGVAAAAACLLAGLFLFNESDVASNQDTHTIAFSYQTVEVANPVSSAVIAPIAQQISRAGLTEAFAEAAPVVQPQKEEVSAEPQRQPHGIPSTGEPSEPRHTSQSQDISSDTDENLWWETDGDEARRNRRPTTLAITSNLGTRTGSSSLMPSSMMLPGVTSAQGTVITPVSEQSYALPLAFGLQAQISLTSHLAVGVGVSYTYLYGTYDALINKAMDASGAFFKVSSVLHYVGVPVSLYCNFASNNNFKFYGTLGGAVEKGLSQKLTYNGTSQSLKIGGLQYSANAGIGAEYRVLDALGIYFDPTVVYYFNCDQPSSIRTAQPLQLRLEVGARFHL